MNIKQISLIAFRGLSVLLSVQGQSKAAAGLNKLVDAIEAGVEVDVHMEAVAQAMASGTEDDWDEIVRRIEAEVSEFLDYESLETAPDDLGVPPDDTVSEANGEGNNDPEALDPEVNGGGVDATTEDPAAE